MINAFSRSVIDRFAVPPAGGWATTRAWALLLLWMSSSFFVAPTAHAQPDSTEYRQAMAQAVRRAAERVLPSVVSVEVVGVAETAGGRRQRSEVVGDAPSCGVVVDADGYIVASDIVLRRPSASLLVVLPDQTRLAATVVARDHHRGLALLKVDAETALTPLELPKSLQTPVGATVIAVGRYGGDGSPMVSTGILSASGRLEGTMLQTDARVSPAFYGGALIDLYGNPIGVVVPAVAEGGAPDETSWYDSGIAFAVPTPVLDQKLPRLKRGEDIHKGVIGIVPASKDPYADDTELAAVRTRSPAEKAGLVAGDEIRAVAGEPVRMFQQIKQALGPHDAGETIDIEFARGGQRKTVSVTLAQTIPPLQPQRLGIWATELTRAAPADDSDRGADAQQAGDGQPTDKPAEQAGAQENDGQNASDANGDDANRAGEAAEVPSVIVEGVIPETPADGKLEVGDRLLAIGDTKINTLATLARQLVTATPETELRLTIERDGAQQRVSLVPAPVAGPLPEQTLESWQGQPVENPWEVQPLRLPDAANVAAYVAPEPEQVEATEALGMVLFLLPPDQRDPEAFLKSWRAPASRQGVVVAAVCSEEEQRWRPNEIDVIARMATMLAQRVPVGAAALAAPGVLEGTSASAADSMVMAVALSDRKNFTGVAVSEETQPPPVRLRENQPDQSLQVLVATESLDDGPSWLTPLTRAGFPIVRGGEVNADKLLRWVRLLQTI